MVAAGGSKPTERGLATTGMLAYIATRKYADHLPLNRLEGPFKVDWIACHCDNEEG